MCRVLGPNDVQFIIRKWGTPDRNTYCAWAMLCSTSRATMSVALLRQASVKRVESKSDQSFNGQELK